MQSKVPNWVHNSGKVKKRKLKPRQLAMSRARLKALKRKLKVSWSLRPASGLGRYPVTEETRVRIPQGPWASALKPHQLTMKRKQLNLTERELQVIIDALKNEWWYKYDPLIETSVQPQYDLLKRFEDAYDKVQATS